MNGLDLFTGIGGITLGLSKWVKPICYCEIEPYAQSVLKSRIKDGSLPAAPIWDDIRTLDGLPFRGLVDIIYAGFPCQDLSVAGKGEGLEGKRSGLFFEIMRLAEEIKPSFIFLENVPAITGRGLDTVVKEIASLRYDCRYGVLSAFDVGAPHKRERWFLLAHSRRDGCIKGTDKNIRSKSKIAVRQNINNACSERSSWDFMADAMCKRTQVQAKRQFTTIELPRSKSENRKIGDHWETEPDVCRVVDELPARMDRIKCLGNAVVPAQVQEAFKRLIGSVP